MKYITPRVPTGHPGLGEFADEYGLGKSLLNTDSSWLQFTSPQVGSGMRGIVESTEM